MLRYKGVLYMKGTDRKVMFQGVHQLMGSDLGPAGRRRGQGSKMVFIGIDLPQDVLLQGSNNASSERRRTPASPRKAIVYNPRRKLPGATTRRPVLPGGLVRHRDSRRPP